MVTDISKALTRTLEKTGINPMQLGSTLGLSGSIVKKWADGSAAPDAHRLKRLIGWAEGNKCGEFFADVRKEMGASGQPVWYGKPAVSVAQVCEIMGMNQSKLAQHLGISDSQISRIANNLCMPTQNVAEALQDIVRKDKERRQKEHQDKLDRDLAVKAGRQAKREQPQAAQPVATPVPAAPVLAKQEEPVKAAPAINLKSLEEFNSLKDMAESVYQRMLYELMSSVLSGIKNEGLTKVKVPQSDVDAVVSQRIVDAVTHLSIGSYAAFQSLLKLIRTDVELDARKEVIGELMRLVIKTDVDRNMSDAGIDKALDFLSLNKA